MAAVVRRYQSSSWGIFRAWSQRSAEQTGQKTRQYTVSAGSSVPLSVPVTVSQLTLSSVQPLYTCEFLVHFEIWCKALGYRNKRSRMCGQHTCSLAAEFIFDVICLVGEEFNDFIFMLLNDCFTLEKKVRTTVPSCTSHRKSSRIYPSSDNSFIVPTITDNARPNVH